MNNEKNKTSTNINTLPNSTSNDDEIYIQYLRSKLEKSKDDLKNGRVITLEEFDFEREALYENYSIKRNKTKYE